MPVNDTLPLIDRWALLTGATGGIGHELARVLVADGANLILHTHTQLELAQQLAAELATDTQQLRVRACDLSDPRARQQLIQSAWDTAPLDILVNNAGVDVLTGPAAELSFGEKLERLWQVDVHATIHLSRSLGRRMRERGSGTIINIGWDQADYGMGGDSGELFAAVKGSVMAFTRSLAKSLAPEVRVNCVAPGWIQTAWGQQASDYWHQRAQRESLRDRWGTPADVAAVVRFLCSPAADFVNGQTIAVNGGWFGHADRFAEHLR